MKQARNNREITQEGNTYYYRNDALHRTNGPAVIESDGHTEYWYNGKQHRRFGPAVIYPDGYKLYIIHGELEVLKTILFNIPYYLNQFLIRIGIKHDDSKRK